MLALVAPGPRVTKQTPGRPADHGLDLGGVVQGIEHRQKAFTGNGEDAVAALLD